MLMSYMDNYDNHVKHARRSVVLDVCKSVVGIRRLLHSDMRKKVIFMRRTVGVCDRP